MAHRLQKIPLEFIFMVFLVPAFLGMAMAGFFWMFGVEAHSTPGRTWPTEAVVVGLGVMATACMYITPLATKRRMLIVVSCLIGFLVFGAAGELPAFQ